MEDALDSISLKPSCFSILVFGAEGSKHSWRWGGAGVGVGGVAQRRTMLARLELQTHQTKRGFLRDRRR